MKLNLGGGHQKIPGYQNIDRKLGSEAYPLAIEDESADVIRASHILEHFPFEHVGAVITNWFEKLKPGGVMKIAVPDFQKICDAYQFGDKNNFAIDRFIYGGHADEDDHHKALFDRGRLERIMSAVGLVDLKEWHSEIQDGAANPISLNLMGRKPWPKEQEQPQILTVKAKVAALGSIPRLGFQAHWGVIQKSFRRAEFDVPPYKFGGAFWEQGMQRGFNALIEEGIDWVITFDYDSICDSEDVKELLTLAALYPDVHAFVPWQAKRGATKNPLFTIRDMAGNVRRSADASEFEGDITPISTGHFGLTLIKMDALKKMKKPWLWGQPNPENGEWDEGRTDADIYFWNKWAETGLKVAVANNVRIGHLEEEITWIDRDFKVIRQTVSDFNENGKPEGCR